jgi:uncharacterized membrane protein YgcG
MKKWLVSLLVLSVCSLVWASDYYIDTYNMDIALSPSNVYSIREDFQVDFSVPRHGIFREIPVRFGKKRVELTNLQSSDPIQQDSVSSDYITFRLGSSDSTVVGLKPYTISYDYNIGDDGYPDYDEMYFNLVGTGWQCPINSFSYTIHFPKAIDPTMVWVTGGSYGSEQQLGSFTVSPDRMTITGTAQNLAPAEALTIRVQMEQGYFTGMKPFRDYTVLASVLMVLFGLGLCIFALRIFQKYGKEDLFVPVVRFDPPEGLSPLEVGFLADGSVDNKDLTSLIFYWADQGCLTIEEQGKKEMTFTKVQEPVTGKKHEKLLFNALFACGDGTTVTLKELETNTFASAMERAKSGVLSYFKGERKLKDSKAESKRIIVVLFAALVVVGNALASTVMYLAEGTVTLMAFGGFVALAGGFIAWNLTRRWELLRKGQQIFKVFSFGLFALVTYAVMVFLQIYLVGNGSTYSLLMAIPSVLFPLFLSILAIVTAKRSPYANGLLEQTVGYREFIDKVEMDKLKMMIDNDPQLFYHVLGYAIVLGLEDKWAKKFKSLTIEPPTWYRGSSPMYDALFYSALAHRLHSNVMEHTLYAQAKGGSSKSVHSSFGSSGFSGGGFGGGGGGAW